MAQPSEQLIDDHAALDTVLKELQTALQNRDVESAHAKLDLFWARLAVHIRAEHLHLFPAVLTNAGIEAQAIVAELRRDHEFFMHELARAVEIMRKPVLEEGLKDVENTILQIEQRLVRHNDLEEKQVYTWATTLLSSEEQAALMNDINSELKKRPSRFTENSWTGFT